MKKIRKYEMMVLLDEKFNHSELKTWVLNFAKFFKKFSACDVAVISRGKQNLSYPINEKKKGNYIQLNFSSLPKYIVNYVNILKRDNNVIRFLIFYKN